MKPKKLDSQGRILETPLEEIINMNHPLVKLAHQINWVALDETLGKLYVQNNGRPGLPTRLVVGLHYLKYAFNYSDEAVVATFIENPYWQYFCGMKYFTHNMPLDPSSMTRWRKRLGKDNAESLLKETIDTAIRTNAMKASEVQHVNVDTTVQEKNISYPTDAKNYNKARKLLVKIAHEREIVLRQSYARLGEEGLRNQARYSHARQMKLAKSLTRKLRNFLGCVLRKLEQHLGQLGERAKSIVALSKRLYEQKRTDNDKVYSLHSPEVECITKGKSHKKYEFGCKASFVSTNRGNWIVGAQALHGRPYDGHTLQGAIMQVERITNRKVAETYCDKGYRLKKCDRPVGYVVHVPGQRGRNFSEKRRMKRSNAIEPIIGHMKTDNRLGRNYLRGVYGDIHNVILSACGFNIRKLLRAFLYRRIRSFLDYLFGVKIFFESMRLRFQSLKFLSSQN